MEQFIPTLNNMGYQIKNHDPYITAFIEYSVSNSNNFALELGAGFGLASREIIKQGGQVYCNDLDGRHLADLANGHNPKLHVIPGDIFALDLPDRFFKSILLSRVIHFFSPQQIENCFAKLKLWLKPKGKLFLTAETPYLRNWQKFIPVFEERKANGEPYPGLIDNPEFYEDSGLIKNLPSYKHKFDVDTMSNMLSNNDFTIEKISYINRKGIFPSNMLLDGRESVGAIASLGPL